MLIELSGIGLDRLISMEETLQPAYGATKRMRRSEALARLTVRQLVRMIKLLLSCALESSPQILEACFWGLPLPCYRQYNAHSLIGATRFLYTEWRIERLRLVIKDDAKVWGITPWVD